MHIFSGRALLPFVIFLLCLLFAAQLGATTHYWSARGTEISYQIDIRPEWSNSKKQKYNYGLMTFWNKRMRIQSESFSQPAFESVEQTIMRRVARLAVLGRLVQQTEPKKLRHRPWPYIYHIVYEKEGRRIRNLEALWHLFGGRRIIRVICSAEEELFSKDREECWNAILSVSPINMDDKAVPQYQKLALETQGKFFKTQNPDQISDRLADIGDALVTTGSSTAIDIAFVVDNTGSMGDSIESVKTKINTFTQQLSSKYKQVRYGLVQYRDAGDDFVTRVTPFTADARAFETSVMAMSANGGGDWPEAMLDAIHAAATKLQWEAPRRIMILIGDAPGHEKVVEAPATTTWQNITTTLGNRGINVSVYSVYATLEISY